MEIERARSSQATPLTSQIRCSLEQIVEDEEAALLCVHRVIHVTNHILSWLIELLAGQQLVHCTVRQNWKNINSAKSESALTENGSDMLLQCDTFNY